MRFGTVLFFKKFFISYIEPPHQPVLMGRLLVYALGISPSVQWMVYVPVS